VHVIYANLCQFKSLGGSRGVLGGLGVSLGGLGPPGGAFAELLGRGLGCLLGAFWMPWVPLGAFSNAAAGKPDEILRGGSAKQS
jgi:hypothetical protein